MLNHILVATDFSTRSDRALRRATMLARAHGTALSLVHVVDSDQPAHLIRAQTTASTVTLRDVARTITDFDRVPADVVVQVGDVFSGILDAADEVAADLVVLGAHRRQLRDIFIGTTADRVIAHSRIPILLAAGVPVFPYPRALVALDIGEQSRSIADRVHDLGILRESQVIVIHAFDAPARGMMKRAMSEQEAVAHYVAVEERRASTDLERLVARTPLRTARRKLSPIAGSAARTIMDCAAEEDAALIVMGASEKKGLERFVLGSVAKDVLQDANRDILLLPR
jgi:nucleotide-binding universal stress UspA family protein